MEVRLAGRELEIRDVATTLAAEVQNLQQNTSSYESTRKRTHAYAVVLVEERNEAAGLPVDLDLGERLVKVLEVPNRIAALAAGRLQ